MEFLLVIFIMVALLLLQGFFSGSEIALVNADKFRLRHLAGLGDKGAKLVLKMFQHPEVLLGTTLVGTNISLVSLTTLGTLLMIHVFGEYGDLLAFFIYTPLFLIFGEVVPKSVYQQKADILAPRIIFPLRFFSILFYPLVKVFSFLARMAARLVGIKPSRHSLFTTREQVRLVLEGAEAAANVDIFDRERLLRAVRFAGATVGEVMIPVAEVIMVERNQSTAEAIRAARKHGCFRLPVYDEEPGQVIGVITLSIWKLMDPQLISQPLSSMYEAVYYVVENQPVDEILSELKQRKDHMGIVVDEFGSAIGIVTLEDVIEQVVGQAVNLGYNFENFLPRKHGKIDELEDERYRIEGRVLLSDLNERLGTPFDYTSVHTIGGLMMKQLKHIPKPGESLMVSGFRFTVETVSEKGIKTILAEPV